MKQRINRKLGLISLIATVATGIPDGICTIEYRESLPPREVVCMGIPMTGIGKMAAHIPGR